VQIEIYELGRDYFRVESENRDEWSRKQTSSGKIEKLTSYNFIQGLLKCESSAAGYSNSSFLTNNFQRAFEGLF